MTRVVVLVLLLVTQRAHAYPEFQLSKDQTCTGCHLSPSGGGLLNENGFAIADAISQFGTAPEFFYNKIPLPSWLELGGDVREQQGFMRTPQDVLVAFPMQADLYAAATYKKLSLHATVGYRPPEYQNEGATHVWSREHYLMFASDPQEGLFLRAGRFMPVFGLRMAEHPLYVRRFGGTPLYGETYAAAIAYITPKYEVHVTGFVRDPLIDPVVHDNGAAGYAELRIDPKTQIGAEGMITVNPDDKKFRGGVTAKRYFDKPDLLLQGELQFVNERITGGGAPNQLVANLIGSMFVSKAVMAEIALGYFNENIRISQLDRECADGNLHWWTTSHLELVLNTRVEMFSFGKGALTGGWALLQLHYRL